MQEREPKLIENEKTAIFVKGQNTSEKVRIAMKDLVSQLGHRIGDSTEGSIHRQGGHGEAGEADGGGRT